VRAGGIRTYSIASILLIIGAGIIAGVMSQHMTAAHRPPWAGAIERVSIYGTLLWIAVLAVVLGEGRRGIRSGRPSGFHNRWRVDCRVEPARGADEVRRAGL